MVRLLYLLTRRPGVTQVEFNDHWAGHHVDTHGRPVGAIRRYVRYQVNGTSPANGGYSGAVSVWCDSEEALAAAMSSAMQAASRDELRFIDHRRSHAVVVDDEVVDEPAWDATVVVFECLSLAGDLAGAALGCSRALIAEPRTDSLLRGLVLSRPRPDSGAVAPFGALGAPPGGIDLVVGYYFDSLLAARLLVDGPSSVAARLGDAVSARRTLPPARRHLVRDRVR